MVKLTVSLAMLAALVPFAAASDCKSGIKYCGYNLLKKGNYERQIKAALKEGDQPVTGDHITNSLFECIGGPEGDITFTEYCTNHCKDGGSGNDDFC